MMSNLKKKLVKPVIFLSVNTRKGFTAVLRLKKIGSKKSSLYTDLTTTQVQIHMCHLTYSPPPSSSLTVGTDRWKSDWCF